MKYSSLGAAVAAFSVFSSAPALAKANAGAAPEVAVITPQTCAFRGTTVDCIGRLKGKVLTRESFAKIPGNTTELLLRNNALRTIPAGAFARLGELRMLDLAFNDFGTLDADVFSNLTKLEDLDLYHSSINYLPTGIFDSTVNLLSLSLGANQININQAFNDTSLGNPDPSYSLFANLKNLRIIDFALDPLNEFPRHLLQNNTKLEMISFMKSQLTRVEPGTFDGQDHLKGLVLAESLFSAPFPDHMVKNCASLEFLFTPSVAFNEISPAVLEGCTNPAFKGFYGARGGRVDVITTPPFVTPHHQTVARIEDLAKLPASTEEISLRALGLTQIPAGAFDKFTNLKKLDLSFNDLRALPPGLFDKLTKLEDLTITDTSLETLPAGLFDNLVQLKTLNLRNGKLSHLPQGIFQKLSGLETLDLDMNRLTATSFDDLSTAFSGMTSLKVLLMNWMYFPEIPENLVADNPNLEQFWFFGNHLRKIPNNFFKNNKKMKLIDFVANDLTEIPDDLFTDKPDLAFVWLLQNRIEDKAKFDKAFPESLRQKLVGYSTWGNPGWHTPIVFSDKDYHACNVFLKKCE